MKFAVAFCLALTGTLIVSCNMNSDKRKSFSDVAAYNDYLIDELDVINEVYTHALDTSISIEDALKACDSLVDLCEKATVKVKGIQPYDGDSSMAMQTLEYVQYMKLNGEKHIKAFLKLEDEYLKATDISEEEDEALYNAVEEAIGKINAEQEKELAKVDLVQKKFAEKYHMIIMK
jgi:hypothetical protein